jgi:hypothetical protein
MTAVTQPRTSRATPRAAGAPRQLMLRQAGMAGGQLAAGAGNAVFAILAARVLAPGAFADLAAFLAIYLLIHVATSALSAGSALVPELAARARRTTLRFGLAVGLGLVLAAVPLGRLIDVDWRLLVDRGRLYGLRRHHRAVASLLAEPLVRLALGLALASVAGAAGGALAVVLAGWAALAAAHIAPARVRTAGARAPAVTSGAAVAAFTLLALVQTQDVLLANALLDGSEAGRFAVLSTVGGIAAFATTTVPLMLLPSRAAGEPGALAVALAIAGGLGLAAVAVVAVAPGALVGAAFGARYAAVGSLVVPYVLAMAHLGVARVLIAHLAGGPSRRAAVAVPALAAVLQTALVLVLGDDAGGVALATLIATSSLTAASGVVALREPGGRAAIAAVLPRVHAPSRAIVAVAALTVAALVVRVLATRSLWLDEATSVWQAGMPLPQMLETMRGTDVHPPLHHLLLWLTVRIAGTSELAVRTPSLLAATAMIPVLFATGRELYDERAGLAAAALGTVAPFAVWYAQEARMYALFMLFAVLALWLQARLLRRPTRRDWVLYSLASVALLATQYFGALFVAVQQAAFLLTAIHRRDRAFARSWLLSLAANEAAGKGFQAVPSQTGGTLSDSGQAPGTYAAITNAVWAVLGYHSDATMTQLAALWPLLMLLALALLGRGSSPRTHLVVACMALPAVALFALGQLKPFVFEVRYFVAAVPLALLLLGRALTSWTTGRAATVAVTGVAVAVLALGLSDQQLNGSNPRIYDFEGALHDVERRAEPGDVVVYSPPYLNHVVAYYGDDLDARPLEQGVPEPRRGHRVFVLGSFLDKPQYRDATAKAVRTLDRKHHLVRSSRRPQIRIWEFR